MEHTRYMTLTELDELELLALARDSIAAGLEHRTRAPLPQGPFSPALSEHHSVFVTLRIDEELRGCCGSIEPSRPLFEEVWCSAAAAAFGDPRFPPLSGVEWPRTHLHLSILEPLQPLSAASEQQLLDQLRPRIDGLVLELGSARVTFLPSVWEQLPDKIAFLRHLKAKAGWHPDFWSPQMKAWRYGAYGIGDEGMRE